VAVCSGFTRPAAVVDCSHHVDPGYGLATWVMMAAGASFRIRGRVQGVGFRPTVHHLANELGLAGDVCNDGSGVAVRLFGPAHALDGFVPALQAALPRLAVIDEISRRPLDGREAPDGFTISASRAATIETGIVPDAATCPDCLAEIFEPCDRRYRYPFTTCTHCGPRFSIARAIPFDRARTTMVDFPMCAACREEYDDPDDRRHHAQANACPVCGPVVWLEGGDGARLDDDPIRAAAGLVASGAIVAIKGLGGFHLACDATSAAAVQRLRQRKRRYDKPFALMARDIAMVQGSAFLSRVERALLTDVAAPITLLQRRTDGPAIAAGVAPGSDRLGFMLPYTPLHHLIMAELDAPIVLTSGNVSDEPQVTDNDAARDRLAGLADAWLMHDRAIAHRLDDSVALDASGPAIARRGRGYAPGSIPLPQGFDTGMQVLAMGAELKNTFALLKGDRITVSHHMGDLEDAAAYADYRRTITLYCELFQCRPQAVAVDLHPDYAATRWGEHLAAAAAVPLLGVQHHHAHIAACMAEHGNALDTPPVLGIALDGLGLGDDGTLWGAEFLKADYGGYDRLAAFQPMPLIGGEAAMREPWRNAFAWLDGLFGLADAARRWPDLPIIALLRQQRPDLMHRMAARGVNAPLASSAGRLFDAVAACLDICPDAVSYEGQAAIELEALARQAPPDTVIYPVDLAADGTTALMFAALWERLLDDYAAGTDRVTVAARFHASLAQAVATTAMRLAGEENLDTVVLSGGVFQNLILRTGVRERLREAGLNVLEPRRFPANDGGIALGQAVIAAARLAHGGNARPTKLA